MIKIIELLKNSTKHLKPYMKNEDTIKGFKNMCECYIGEKHNYEKCYEISCFNG